MLKCFLPFKERSMWANHPGGFRISPCCKIPGIEYTEEDITNIKKELYSSEKNIPNECSYCWNTENKGLISWRHNEGVVPEKWKDAKLILIHNSDSKSLMSNYGSISLLGVLSK